MKCCVGSWALAKSASFAAMLAVACSSQALAVKIEIDDVAPDRIERQRSFAEGELPLPGTPKLGDLDGRLAKLGLTVGSPIFIRVFKAESELEVWVRKDSSYTLFATYPICHWAGTLGPKLAEGDKQNPEGFYSVSRRQLHRIGRWPRSLNVGYPNAFDRANNRTGSYILVHGGCSSVGCFAMTNAVMDEVFVLVEAALKKGQQRVGLHVFPFRMTETNLASYAGNAWIDFWRDLKRGYDAFESTRNPPKIGICDKRYVIETVLPGAETTPKPAKLGRRISRRLRSQDLPDACDAAERMAAAVSTAAPAAAASFATGSTTPANVTGTLQPLGATKDGGSHPRTASANPAASRSRANPRRSAATAPDTSSLPLVFSDQIHR
jgi:murein L,D-transpeptidase YafK